LHARDNEQLLSALHRLQARGNSLVVVEHDEETMRRADHIVDLGPGAGLHGGQVVASGTFDELLQRDESLTGQYLRAQAAKSHPERGQRRPVDLTRDCLTLEGAHTNNLKNLVVQFPLQRFVVVTGVSGSGKSTLIRECLLPTLLRSLNTRPGSRGRAADSRD